MVSVEVFCFNAFAENTFIIEEGRDCLIVDPGCYDQDEYQALVNHIQENDLKPSKIINTHCHIDHILGVDQLKEYYGIPFYIHKNDQSLLESSKVIAPVYGFQSYREPEVDGFLEEGEEVLVGSSVWRVIEVPGHAPGHIALYNDENRIVIAGDVLFQNSIGRTDLPGGNYDTLLHSIRNKLFTLPDDVIVYPGHGPETTIGYEKQHNPFCGQNQ